MWYCGMVLFFSRAIWCHVRFFFGGKIFFVGRVAIGKNPTLFSGKVGRGGEGIFTILLPIENRSPLAVGL
jgi:hypothetical protein